MTRAISPETADVLRAVAERIASEPVPNPAGGWPIPIKLGAARAYVWAVYERRDPVLALGRWMFGDYGLYYADPRWMDLSRRRGSRTWWAVERVEALAALRLNIPTAEQVAA